MIPSIPQMLVVHPSIPYMQMSFHGQAFQGQPQSQFFQGQPFQGKFFQGQPF